MAGETVVHPDTVATITSHLNAALTPPVSSNVPNPRPAEFVTVRRTGGPRASKVSDRPQVTVEAWSTDPESAHDLAQLCRSQVTAMADGTNRSGVIVYRVDEFAGPADLPDPDSRQSRFTFTLSVHSRTAP
jgi:hypothetical protein